MRDLAARFCPRRLAKPFIHPPIESGTSIAVQIDGAGQLNKIGDSLPIFLTTLEPCGQRLHPNHQVGSDERAACWDTRDCPRAGAANASPARTRARARPELPTHRRDARWPCP